MPTVRALYVPTEVPCTVRGRPSYRWAPRYAVEVRRLVFEYPAVTRAEAYARAREIAGPKAKVQFVTTNPNVAAGGR